LEIACTRLARPEADLTIEALAERVARLEAMVANAAVPASVAAAGAAPAAVAAAPVATQQPTLISGARAAAPVASTAPTATPARQGGMPWDRGAATPAAQPAPAPKPAAPAPQPAPAPMPQPTAASAPVPAAAPAPKPQPNTAAQVAAAGAAETPAVEDAGELQRKWVEVVERVKAQQPSYAALLLNARATADDGSKLTVSFPTAFAIKMLGRADTQAVFLPTVSAVFGRRTVDYVLDGGVRPAPQHEEHSPSARAAASADPQPVSSAAPASLSASATQPKAAPVAAPIPSAIEPAVSKPAAPIPASKPAAAPAPKSSDLAKAPWLRSDNLAGAPATGKLPTVPAPRAPERASAPKIQPSVQAAPWESEQVPYDDAMVGGFAGDASGEDLAPFDMPAAAPAPSPAASAAAPAAATSAPASDDALVAPWESNPGAGSPFGHQGAAPGIPQTEDEAKALIRSVFGQSTIFKPVE
ncbi:MAG: hypothetical protein SO051_04885, partial [Collinsella sp.]|nr:hypothetical protein [Collinsella sp.]